MKKNILKFFLLSFILLSLGCAESSIFQPIPLNANPPVLAQPIFMAIDETTARGYLINSNNQVEWANASLMVLNLSNPVAPTVVKAVELQNFSGQAVYDPVAKLLYITNRFDENLGIAVNQIFVVNVDESSPNFLTMSQFTSEPNPFGITTDGTNLYTANTATLNLFPKADLSHRSFVEFNIQTTSGTIPITENTREVAISPTGQFLFVSNQDDVLLILDKTQIPQPDPTLEVTSGGSEAVDYVVSNTISTFGIASDANYVYVVQANPNMLQILTDRTLPVVAGPPQQILLSSVAVAQVPLGEGPQEIALDTVNGRAYVPNAFDNTLSVIDTTLFAEVARIIIPNTEPDQFPEGPFPFGVSVGHFGGVPFVYVLNQNTNNISIINGSTLTFVGNFPQ